MAIIKKQPIFLIGWFRSGTTMYWNFFRSNSMYTCFYEPLHEHLLDYVEGSPSSVDPTHLNVENYWDEYKQLPIEIFKKKWRKWFGRERFVLDENQTAQDLYNYLNFLIENSEGIPVLKFVRGCHRARWLRKNFPDARIIHLVRNPRSVWASMSAGGQDDEGQSLALVRDNGFLHYMLLTSIDLGIDEVGHPYRRFFQVWKSGYLQVEYVADETWWYEDTIDENSDWYESVNAKYQLNISKKRIVSDIDAKKKFHSNSWYYKNEIINNYDNKSYGKKVTENEKIYLDKINYLRDANIKLNIELARIKEEKYKSENIVLSLYFKIKKNIIKFFINNSN